MSISYRFVEVSVAAAAAAAMLCTVAGEFWNTDFYFPRATQSGTPPADWPQCPPPPARCRALEGRINSTDAYYKYRVDGMLLPLYRKGDEVTLSCKDGVSLHSGSLPSFSDMTSVSVVRLKYCDLPSDSYAARLALLNVSVTRDLELIFYYKQKPTISKIQFEGLAIDYLRIEYETSVQNLYLADGWLEPLTELTRLDVSHVSLPPMPASNRLRDVSVHGSTARGAWGGCGRLRALAAAELRWQHAAPPRWLAACPRLRALRLRATHLYRRLLPTLAGLHSLRILEINYGLLGFNDGDTLTKLFSELLQPLAATLEELSLIGNDLGDVCELDGHDVKLPLRLPALRRLSLANSGVTRLCDSWPQDLPALVHLDLTGNTIETVQYRDLKWLGARQSQLLLSDVGSIAYQQSEYSELVRGNCSELGVNVSISGWLQCDCRVYWAARALAACPRHARLAPPPACARLRRPLPRVTPASLRCPAQDPRVCASGCDCFWRDPSEDGVVAECAARGLRRLPRVSRPLELHVANNFIDTIHGDDIPDTLLYLDLRSNNVSRISDAEVVKLFSVRERQVQLAGNPLRCHCDNRLLLDALLTHRDQVDYSNLRCNDEKLLSTIVVDDLCALSSTEILVFVLSPTLIMFFLVLLACWSLYYYRMEVRVYLYARGLCQCCIREEDLDCNKEFDAFVSYTHHDEQFVYERLVPELEHGLPSFKLCIHTRDWVVGEWVPAQIIRSVDNSRRTIIIMSRNFLSSVWGLMEFRAAHMTAMREGRARIIVVLLEDLGEHPHLDDELKAYLTTNTYLKWGDPRFFNKLRYALPHRRGERTKRRAREQTANDLYMVEFKQHQLVVRDRLPQLPAP